MSEFRTILANSPELLEAAWRFRYLIYVEHMGRRQIHADHVRRWVREPLDETGRVYLALRDGEVVGTIRGNFASDPGLDYYVKLYKLERFGFRDLSRVQFTTKLIVHPDMAGSILAPRMIAAYAAEGYRLGVEVDFIDCNKHLISFFEKMGYFSYCGWTFHKEYGSVRPMFFPVDVVAYLKELRSFLYLPARAALADGQYGGYERIARHASIPKGHLAAPAYDRRMLDMKAG